MSSRGRSLLLFTSGSIGDFLMFLFLADQACRSGVYDCATIIVSKGGTFLKGFLEKYPKISLIEISKKNPGKMFMLLAQVGQAQTVAIQPTLGRIPLRLKLFAFLLTRMPGSALVGFQDTGPLCSLYTKALHYRTDIPYTETISRLAHELGAAVSTRPELKISGDESIFAKLAVVPEEYAFFHPRGSSEKRSFEQDDARAVLETLLAKYPKVVFSGSSGERIWLEEVVHDLAPELRKRIAIASACSVPELATLVRGGVLYIGVDTGITHLACFLGVKVLCVAHRGTANWLPFYNPRAEVIYRLEEDTEAHEGVEYLKDHLKGRIKPFGKVPVMDVCKYMNHMFYSARA